MDNIFEKYEINEISQKTHISPVILNKLKSFNFKNIDKIKLKGFIKILETEYPDCDFSKLKEHIEIENKINQKNMADVKFNNKENNSLKSYLIVLFLILIIGFLIYYMNKNSIEKIETNITDNNVTFLNEDITKTPQNFEINDTNTTEENSTIEISKNQQIELIEPEPIMEENLTLVVIPSRKVWYKITYLDNGKSKQDSTSKEFDLNGSKRIFIKFGHGMVKLKCNNNILEPNSTKVTRVIIDKCDMNITLKKLKEFK